MKRQDQLDGAAQRRVEVLAFVAGYLVEHEYAPSVDEITAHTGVASTRTTRTDLRHLAEAGWVTRRGGVHRGMLLTDAGLDMLADRGRRVADTPMAGAR